MRYQIQIRWRGEMDYNAWRTESDLDAAIRVARAAQDMGDGASVKNARVYDLETGLFVWIDGRMTA